jgi:hypothetical protein
LCTSAAYQNTIGFFQQKLDKEREPQINEIEKLKKYDWNSSFQDCAWQQRLTRISMLVEMRYGRRFELGSLHLLRPGLERRACERDLDQAVFASGDLGQAATLGNR